MPPKVQEKKKVKQVIRVHDARQKKKHAEHEGNGERWLLTYADMITLLLALFIILFAISTPNKVKYDALAKEMAGGFGPSTLNIQPSGPQMGQQASGKSKDTKTSQEIIKAAQASKQSQELEKKIKQTVAKLKMQQRVQIKRTSRGIVVSLLTDRTSFQSGSAILQPGAEHLLSSIAPFLAHITNEIRIEGNTDNIPIQTAEYPTNWELSAARAVGVTRFLSEQEHLNPQRLSAAGYGQYKPQTDNNSEAHRQLNRRVDIVILNTRLAKDAEKSQQDDVGTVSGGN